MPLWIETKIEQLPFSHRQYNDDGKCKFNHGHNWDFLIQIEGNIDNIGYVADFKKIKNAIRDIFDHVTVLYENDPFVELLLSIDQPVVKLPYNPTCENIAKYVTELIIKKFNSKNNIKQIIITVWENKDSKATYNLLV